MGVWLAEAGKRGKRIAGVKKRSIYTRPALEKTKYLSVGEAEKYVLRRVKTRGPGNGSAVLFI